MRDRVPEVRQVTGVVTADGRVNVAGADLSLPFPAGFIPTPGDLVSVDLVSGRGRVTGPVIRGQRPSRGTVSAAPSGGLLPVSTATGAVRAEYAGTAPDPGTVVFLDWQQTTPRVWSSAAAVAVGSDAPPPPPAVPPPARPPAIQTGTLYVTAVTSGGYTPSRGWATPRPTQGTLAGNFYRGAWFYGTRPAQLRGRTITGMRIRIPALGPGSPAFTASLYRHTSAYRPGGNVTIVGASTSAAATGAVRWVTLPTAWGQAIVDTGGGIALGGAALGILRGITDDPASGQLALTWRT